MSTQNGALCSCGCCDEQGHQALPELSNAPGLPALQYRLGTQGSFKDYMLGRFAKHAAFSKLGNRADDDHSVATVDAWATVLDVLCFYQERNINEGFLRTATERMSVLELARHIDYKLKPGVAASTLLAFSMNEAIGAPESAVLPAGTKVQSIPAQDELPQVFETSEEITARVDWNGIRVQTRERIIPKMGDADIYLDGINTGLQPGDALLFIGDERASSAGSERWDFRKVQRIAVNNAANYTHVTWAKKLGNEQYKILPASINFKVYALRQKASLFGFNAPDFRLLSGTVKSAFIKSGLLAEYYSGKAFDTHILSRTESAINNNWNGSPVTGVSASNFSVRWTGTLLTTAGGEHTFFTDSDDGVRLWVNNQLIIDNWTDHPATRNSETINLQAGSLYGIRLEYFQGTGSAKIVLSWSASGLPEQVIPADRFFNAQEGDEWPDFNIAGIAGAGDTVVLDALYPKIVQDSWVVISTTTYEEVYKVDSAEESARKNFSLSAKASVLKLSGENLSEKFDAQVRAVTVYGQSEEMTIAATPVETWLKESREVMLETLMPDLPAGKTIVITGKRKRLAIINPANKKTPDIALRSLADNSLIRKLLPGATLIITAMPADSASQLFRVIDDAGSEGYVTLNVGEYTIASAADDDLPVSEAHEIASLKLDQEQKLTVVVLKAPVSNWFDPPTIRISANVAHATHGETRTETLGSGNGSQTFQQFKLKQKPLTFVSAATAAGIQTTLEIRVGGILWTEISSLYEAAPKDKVYTTSIEDDGTVTIRFGDGITGARLPTGVENIRAVYRVGIGTAGLLDAGQLSMLLSPQPGVNKVTNPLATSGAEDPEPRDAARQNAPLTVLTLDRIISSRDYEDFARGFAGIGKARADIIWIGERQVVFITIAASDGSAIDKQTELYKNLQAAIAGAGHSNNQVLIESFKFILFSVKARILIDAAYLFSDVQAAVQAALLDNFSFEVRAFGQSTTPAEVIAIIQSVPGVVYTDLERLNGTDPATTMGFRLNANIARLSGTGILPAELLTIDPQAITITQISA